MLYDYFRFFSRKITRPLSMLNRRHTPTADDSLLTEFPKWDQAQNAETTPPADEKIDLCCVWAAEIYTPSHTEGLLQALREFDQETRTATRASDDLASWLEGAQRQLYGISWRNLGTWVPKRETNLRIFREREVDLPDPVEYAHGMMFSLSPTLNCIVICFVFREEMSNRYDSALRKDRETFTTPTGRGWSYHMPINQKGDDIQQARSHLSELIQTWFQENLPGAFSSLTGEITMPTCELVTFREAVPFPDSDEPTPPAYLSLLGLGHHLGVWKHSELPRLRFGFHSARSGPRHWATLTINLRDLQDANPNRESQDAKSWLLSHLNLPIPELMSTWAIVILLQNFGENLVRIQNSTVLHADQGSDHVKALRQLTEYVSNLSDLSAISVELSEGDRERQHRWIQGPPFLPARKDRHPHNATLDITLWRLINAHAKSLRAADRNIRDMLSQIGALIGAQENVRLQKKISTLTKVILIVTIIALGIAIFQPLLQSWVSETAQQGINQLRNAWPPHPW